MKKGLLFLLCFSLPAAASVAPKLLTKKKIIKPIEAIQELDRMIDSYRVGKNLTQEDEEYNKKLKRRILRGTFDLGELAKLSLDKYWDKLSKIEQNQFVELLTNLLEERSVFAKEKAQEKGEGDSYSVSYKAQKYKDKKKTDAWAHTVVYLKKKGIKVSLDYKLKRNSQDWKIYDVIMDDASLVANYRYSFGKIIKKDGYPELVRRMRNKLQEFREKRNQDGTG